MMAGTGAKNGNGDSRGVQSITVGAKLLSVLTREAESLMLKDLALAAGIPPAQAHAYLVSYRKLGLVEKEEPTGRYRLGPFALDLGLTRMSTFDTLQIAHEAVVELSAQSGLTVALIVWGSFGPTVIQVRETGSQLNMDTRAGTVYSLSGTASGLVFAAFLPEALVKEAISTEKKEAGRTGRVGQPRFVPKQELDKIRAQGFATIGVPPVPGIYPISAPVFDHSGQVQYAITLIGQQDTLGGNSKKQFVDMLLATTTRLSNQLGYATNEPSY